MSTATIPTPEAAAALEPARPRRPGITHITVRGARQHNLKNVDVAIPRNTLTVVTGLSGSGKSSLAFDTIYAEGQRRYVETLSAYARQFLDQMERPDVDSIDGLSPAISIEQKTTSRSPRSTVGTITEIYDYLRLLYASVGQPHCPNCARPISRQSAEQIVERITALSPGERITVMAPIVRGRKGEFREELEALDQQGFRARIDGELTELTEGMRLEKRKNHTVEAIVDRIILKPLPPNVNEALAESVPHSSTVSPSMSGSTPNSQGTPKYDTRRLEASVQKALAMANGLVLIALQNPHTRHQEETLYSSTMACPDCGINVPKLEPRSFSFNSNYGACPECHGLGSIYDFDPAKTITDWSKPLLDGALGPGSASQYLLKLIKLAADKYKINLKLPFADLPKPHQDLLLHGPPPNESGRTGFHGIFAYLRANLDETKSEGYREYMMQYMSATRCPRCQGRRLRPESLAVTIPIEVSIEDSVPHSSTASPSMSGSTTNLPGGSHNLSIADYTALSLARALTSARLMHFTGREHLIADRLQREIIERLEFLNAVGLGYLSLDRSAATLSGGEGQRIRLATQIGSRLRGVLYVLDEPSIGLHQRDNQRLIAALERLRDLGNTVLVVEHDEDTIRKADYVLDLGPAAGKLGGHLIAAGTPAEIMANPASITGQYLAGKIPIVTRPANALGETGPRPLTGNWITVRDAHSHNLANVTAHFPLGVMTVVTGVSGSGKSTLVNDILYRALAKELYGSREEPGTHGAVIGVDQLDKVIQIDQSPIGRTPRSNPATYTGVFTAIRDLFAQLPESRERGYKPGRFSFNVQGGRCEACSGDGQRRIEMNFLPDVYVLCEVCMGRRYNHETLQVRFNGYNIADLLDLPIADALPILKDIPAVGIKLQTLVDVGLGYIHLGQSATTLSGGEAQRMKLARELSKRQTGRTLYVLDEPTTGLHFDDVRRLLDVLHRLTDLGNTVLIIEHNLDIIRNADYLLDMGPEGGEYGGQVIAHGTPAQVATVQTSHTATFLRPHFPELSSPIAPSSATLMSSSRTPPLLSFRSEAEESASSFAFSAAAEIPNPNAGPQPTQTAAPDAIKTRTKFIPNEKKNRRPLFFDAVRLNSSKGVASRSEASFFLTRGIIPISRLEKNLMDTNQLRNETGITSPDVPSGSPASQVQSSGLGTLAQPSSDKPHQICNALVGQERKDVLQRQINRGMANNLVQIYIAEFSAIRSEILQLSTKQGTYLIASFLLTGFAFKERFTTGAPASEFALIGMALSAVGILFCDTDRAIIRCADYGETKLRARLQYLTNTTNVLQWEEHIRRQSSPLRDHWKLPLSAVYQGSLIAIPSTCCFISFLIKWTKWYSLYDVRKFLPVPVDTVMTLVWYWVAFIGLIMLWVFLFGLFFHKLLELRNVSLHFQSSRDHGCE